MPKILGLELSGSAIVLRFFEAALFSMLAFALLFYVPTVIPPNLSGFVNLSGKKIGTSVLSKIIQPTEPSLGLVIVLLVFAGVLARGTNVYGYLVALNGVSFWVYVYSFFQGGVVKVVAVGTAFGASNATLNMSLDATLLMFAFMVPPALTVVKGLLLVGGQLRHT